jgi:hypothetical protein
MDAFAQHRSWQRAYRLGLSQLLCLGPHTVTNLLATCGRQFVDWSADYRLFSQGQWEPRKVFRPVIRGLLEICPDPAVFVIALDDTHLPKSGKKTPGVGWGRDPLSPPFHCNLIRRQRFIQFSGALYADSPPGPARAVPIWFEHAPALLKPKRSAPAQEWKAYRARTRQENLCTHAAAILHWLRKELDQEHHAWGRQLVACSDASYFNQTVLKRLPPRTTFIGRIRKDVELFYPAQPSGTGLKKGSRKYGLRAPKPDQLRQDPDHPWQPIVAFAAGKLHTFRIKTLAPVLWSKAGADRPLRLMVVAPVGYRIRKNSRMLYRQPAFLLCTDPDLPVEKMLQYYLWRWDIENDHRDEKRIIGVGQAQLTSARSVDRQPQLAVGSYAMLLLAAVRAFGHASVDLALPPPKWLANRPKPRVTTQDLIQQLRHEVWAHALSQLPGDPTRFVTGTDAVTKGQGTRESLASAVLYVRQG